MSLPGLVMIPGLNCTGLLFAAQTARLARHLPVLVPDPSRYDSIRAMAEAVLSIAPPRFALAGLSMGGYVAFEILRLAPDRVTRAVFLDTTAKPDVPERTALRRQQIAAAQSGRFDTVVEGLWPNLVHPARHEDRALKAVHLAMCAEVGPEGFVRSVEAIIGRSDSRPGLSALALPVEVIVGEQDALTPVSEAREIADAIPGATLHVVPNTGHLSTLERPEAVTHLLESFLLART